MSKRPPSLAGLLIVVAAGCHHQPGQPAGARPPSPSPPPSHAAADDPDLPPTPVPVVELVSEAEWEACVDELEGGLTCDEQSLEGGVPLRYRHFPAVTSDGGVLAVVEERDGWGHVSPGVRILGRDGRTVRWLPLDGTGAAAAAAVERTNAALAEHTWRVLSRPELAHRELAPDRSETTLLVGRYQVVYERRSDGNVYLAPATLSVTDTDGRVVAARTDTEVAWAHSPACNLPAFEFVGASATPGVLLFKTGLGMGGHNCDGVEQPPAWHVLPFGDR